MHSERERNPCLKISEDPQDEKCFIRRGNENKVITNYENWGSIDQITVRMADSESKGMARNGTQLPGLLTNNHDKDPYTQPPVSYVAVLQRYMRAIVTWRVNSQE